MINNVTGNTQTKGAGASSKADPSTDPAAAQDRFLTLLVAQLAHQDPMNPMDNAQMTSQMAQINTVVGINQLNSTMEAMSSQFTSMQVLQGTSMIGRTVLSAGDRMGAPVEKISTAAFDLEGSAGDVQVKIIDASGKVVDTVKLGSLDAGRHYFAWDSSTYAGAPGVDPHSLSGMRFQVEAVNGTAKVANTTLSPNMVVATSTSSSGLTLELENGESLDYNKVKAVF